MRVLRRLCLWVLLALLLGSLGACSRVPRGNWHVETGRAPILELPEGRQPRIAAVAEAQQDARLKLLRFVQSMTHADSTFVGDYMARNPAVNARIQSLILSAPQFEARYPDGRVEVDMGVNVDEVRRLLAQ